MFRIHSQKAENQNQDLLLHSLPFSLWIPGIPLVDSWVISDSHQQNPTVIAICSHEGSRDHTHGNTTANNNPLA